MARYELEIGRGAEKQLWSLPRPDQVRLVRSMRDLADHPHPRGSRKLTGYDDVFRIRVGRYRVLYSIAEGTLIIVVLKIGHRKDVYR